MKNTEKVLQDKLLKLLDSYKIDEIDVNLLCNTLGIKRQTFYYHYKNIYELIYSIYYEKKLDVSEKPTYEEILTQALEFLYSDEFNRDVFESNASTVLKEFILSFFIKSFANYLSFYKISSSQRKEEARFLASAINEQMFYYFKDEEETKKTIYHKLSLFLNKRIIDSITKNYFLLS
jgi:AcrR family transcriptional regulator